MSGGGGGGGGGGLVCRVQRDTQGGTAPLVLIQDDLGGHPVHKLLQGESIPSVKWSVIWSISSQISSIR